MVEEDSVILGEYTYNGLGQRIIKAAGGLTTIFHYDFDGNIIAESDESGNFDKEYLYRSSSRLALVDVETGELYYYGNDRLGTPQILTDSTNTVVWEAIYKPFGEAEVNSNSTVENNFRFAGQYFDEETGFHYNYLRYYDPRTGRYLRPDPIGLEEGYNLFIYVTNNPIMLTDPTGEKVSCSYSITGRTLSCKTKSDEDCEEKTESIICYATSGNNNPNDQCLKDVGPIPVGGWNIGVPLNNWVPLTRKAGNKNCLNRSGFYIHGWGVTKGCIAIKLNECRNKVMDALRDEGGGTLEVTR